jgi:hypothetical protein
MSGNSNNTKLQISNDPLTNIYTNNMNNTNLTQDFGVINPKATRYKAYDLIKERYVNYVDQYGRTAKRLYKQYIDILGYEPEMVMPNNLKYYPDSDRFYKYKPKKACTYVYRSDYNSNTSFATLLSRRLLPTC